MLDIIKTHQEILMMNTKQIAVVLGKQHSNIKISAERLAENGTIALRVFMLQQLACNGIVREYQ